jgi:pimeloyl-ACP methyl ester carboxylesterase
MAESIVYIHGVPNSGEMWSPFLERTGGVAPDLPGFGSTDKPADLDYSMPGQTRWVAEYLSRFDRFSLVMHDWGALGLLAALERPEDVDRIVLFNAVPFLPDYRWHRIARLWRAPLAGELMMGFSTSWGLRLLARREADGRLPKQVVDAQVDQVLKHWDHGTQRAILKLYRSAPEGVLAEAGRDLGRIGARSLVMWGDRDRYLPLRFGNDYAGLLGADLQVAQGAGHWPWLEQPELIERTAAFLR